MSRRSSDSLRRGMARLGAFFRREPLDRDLEAEMASHIAMAIEENMTQGNDAGGGAGGRRWCDSVEWSRPRSRQRESRGAPGLEILLQDLRYTMRTLGRDRGFATIAILILALGHWRERRCVQRGEHNSAAAAAVLRSFTVGLDCAGECEGAVRLDVFGGCV